MITRKEYELIGDFKYYNNDEIKRRTSILNKELAIINKEKFIFNKIYLCDICTYITENNNPFEYDSIEEWVDNINMKKCIYDFIGDIDNMLEYYMSEPSTTSIKKTKQKILNMFNTYPAICYMYISIDILILIKDVVTNNNNMIDYYNINHWNKKKKAI